MLFMYLGILFDTSKCHDLYFSKNLLTKPTLTKISILVLHEYVSKLMICLYMVVSTSPSLVSFFSFILVSMRVIS